MRKKTFFIKLINIICICVTLFVYQEFAHRRLNQIKAMEEKAMNAQANIEKNDKANSKYKDGVYNGSADGYGGVIEVELTIKNGQFISAKALHADNETPEYFKQAQTIFDEVVSKQTIEVDVVTGATYSSNGIIEGLKEALNKAK